MSENQKTLKAIVILLAGLLCFDVMILEVRYLLANYSAPELSAYRNVFGILPSLLVMLYTGELQFQKKSLALRQWKLAFVRGAIVAVAQLTFYSSVGFLELATISALGHTSGLFMVLLSIFLFKERVGKWRWGALIIGFWGAILIIQPGSETFSISALLPLVAAFSYALYLVSMRYFDDDAPNALIYIYASFASGIVATVFALLSGDITPIASLKDGFMILLMSMAGGTGMLLMMFAYRTAPASALAPFGYFAIISAFVFGWIFFGEFPVDKLFPGVLLIILAGTIIIWREHYVRQKQTDTV